MLISIFMLQLIMNRMKILLLGQLLVLEKEAVSEPQLDKSISIPNMSNQLKTQMKLNLKFQLLCMKSHISLVSAVVLTNSIKLKTLNLQVKVMSSIKTIKEDISYKLLFYQLMLSTITIVTRLKEFHLKRMEEVDLLELIGKEHCQEMKL